jgi:AAA domain
MSPIRAPLTTEEKARRAAVLATVNGGGVTQTPPSDAEPAIRELHSETGFSSWERALQAAKPENRPVILLRACVALYRLAAKAKASHVQIADWATTHGQIFAIEDADAIQEIICRAKRESELPERAIHTTFKINGAANSERSLIIQCANEIEVQPIEWLWRGRIARGKHTCIAGEPGTGKSQLSIAIIAALTTGGDWPCGEGRAPIGNVIILSAEDGAADTIVPRLLGAGADRSRVHLVSAVRDDDGGRRALNLQQDLDLLERKIAEIGNVVLVVVDPVSSYLGKTDSHKNSEVRGVLEPLSEMADRMRVAILSITHFSKSGANTTTKALHRFIGSIAFTGAPRVAFVVIEDAEQEGRRLFLHALERKPQGLAFRLEQRFINDGVISSRVIWDAEPVAITADEALAADATGNEARTAKANAKEFLKTVLTSGSVPAAEVTRMAREHGLTNKVIRSAREALGVTIERDGFGPGSKSLWALPRGHT